MSKLWHHGQQYAGADLTPESVDPDPAQQFLRWFAEADEASLDKVNAMALATSTPEGVPSVRMVLLKELAPAGFVFFTNYSSRKGHDLSRNPAAALLFYWKELDRQVRIEGRVSVLPDTESDAYFASRPFESRLGAIASPQSATIASHEQLKATIAQLGEQYDESERPPPRPSHWGGYCLAPSYYEFWQGQPNRLHQRVAYVRDASGFERRLLAP